ncbi:MAG: hypothetical protein II822_02050 [Prevotella sp.]|nr:hypothetical protein [Prevotella sp.]
MKRTTIVFALLAFFHIAIFGQTRYTMVIEKTDGTTIEINTEDIARTYFRVRNEGTGGEGGGGGGSTISNPTELVGIWAQYYTSGATSWYIGIKLDANGDAAYTEWDTKSTPNWNYTGGAKWSVDGNVLNVIAPNGSLAFSSAYTISNDGNTLTFIGEPQGSIKLEGEFVKL